MRSRVFAFLALGAIVLSAACNGGDESTALPTLPPGSATSTPAPTATPLARIPEPILVTGAPGAETPTATETGAEYVVEAGDSLGAIATRFGVDPDVIRAANGIEGDDIFIGQTLIIPRGGAASGGTAVPATTPESPAGGDGNTYVVQQGDTAFGIALEFDTTVEALAAANGMSEDQITNLQIGQVINLPRPQ